MREFVKQPALALQAASGTILGFYRLSVGRFLWRFQWLCDWDFAADRWLTQKAMKGVLVGHECILQNGSLKDRHRAAMLESGVGVAILGDMPHVAGNSRESQCFATLRSFCYNNAQLFDVWAANEPQCGTVGSLCISQAF